MPSPYATIAAAAGLALAGAAHVPPPPPGSQDLAADSVFVTAAHGDALVPVQVLASHQAVTATGAKVTWSGDTLRARTPLALIVHGGALITVQSLDGQRQIRVTVPRNTRIAAESRTGSRVFARAGRRGWSFTTAP